MAASKCTALISQSIRAVSRTICRGESCFENICRSFPVRHAPVKWPAGSKIDRSGTRSRWRQAGQGASGAFEPQRRGIEQPAIEGRAKARGEAFQPVERASLLEDLRRQAICGRRREDASAAAGRLWYAAHAARCRCRGSADCRWSRPRAKGAMILPLDHPAGVIVRADTADQQMVPVQHQVMDGDRPGHTLAPAATKSTPSVGW